MDRAYWANINADIKFRDTTKQYFGKYLWRMALSVPGCKLLTRPEHWTFDDAYRMRKEYQQRILPKLSVHPWWPRPQARVEDFDVDLLHRLDDIQHEYSEQVRIRVEEPRMQFYAESEEVLKDIAQEITICYDVIKDITGPASDTQADLLKTGVILTSKAQTYQYKIIVRDGMYPEDVKIQLLNYLDSLGSEVEITAGCRKMLLKPYPNVWGVYFYVRDEQLVTFINLICPGMVSNIHRLVSV
jgi:hypothetical protein